MEDKDLINLMVKETFASSDNVISFSPFKFTRIKFIETTNCFRLHLDDHVIDFPSNWSIFTSIKNCIDGKSDYLFIELDESQDLDFLFSILSGNVSSKVVIFAKGDEVKFIRVNEENEQAVSALKNDFLKRALASQESEISEEKVAA